VIFVNFQFWFVCFSNLFYFDELKNKKKYETKGSGIELNFSVLLKKRRKCFVWKKNQIQSLSSFSSFFSSLSAGSVIDIKEILEA